MTEVLRQIIIGISISAMLSSTALFFVKSEAMKEVVKLAAGAVMIIAIIGPMVDLNFEIALPEDGFLSSKVEIGDYEHIEVGLVARRLEEYIENKAKDLGILCEVFIEFSKNEDNQYIPAFITVYGEGDLNIYKLRMAEMIRYELNIVEENQSYIEGEQHG